MEITKYHWVCSYDIRHPKRLAQVHQLLCMLGIAINYSVFYLFLSRSQFQDLCRKLNKIIRIEDDVRLYKSTSLQSAYYIGSVCPAGISLLNAQGVIL